MRKAFIIRTLLTAVVLFAAPSLYAQRPIRPMTDEQEWQLIRSELLSRNKQFIAMNLPLTEAEARKFWPVYDQYAAELMLIYDLRDALLMQYAENFWSLTDEMALNYARRWAEADAATARLRLKYLPIVEKVLPGRKAALFFQLDGRVAVRIDSQVSAEVPLIRP